MTDKTSEKRAFTLGFAMACANVARDHGEDTLAEYLLEDAGLTLQDLIDAGLEDYDLEPLRPILATIDERVSSRETKATARAR